MVKPEKTLAEMLAQELSPEYAKAMESSRRAELEAYWAAVAAKVTTSDDVRMLLGALIGRCAVLNLNREIEAVHRAWGEVYGNC